MKFDAWDLGFALKECSRCGTVARDASLTCGMCGADLVKVASEPMKTILQRRERKQLEPSERRISWENVGILLILVAVIYGVLFLSAVIGVLPDRFCAFCANSFRDRLFVLGLFTLFTGLLVLLRQGPNFMVAVGPFSACRAGPGPYPEPGSLRVLILGLLGLGFSVSGTLLIVSSLFSM